MFDALGVARSDRLSITACSASGDTLRPCRPTGRNGQRAPNGLFK